MIVIALSETAKELKKRARPFAALFAPMSDPPAARKNVNADMQSAPDWKFVLPTAWSTSHPPAGSGEPDIATGVRGISGFTL